MKSDQLVKQLLPILQFTKRYRALLFFVALMAIYGYVITRINAAVNTAPAANTSANSSTIKIDKSTISKVEQMEDNSVSVHTLFDQARQNPFSE